MASGKIVCEDHYIDALDSGIRLHVREKRPKGKHRFTPAETLLIVHGRDPAAPEVSADGQGRELQERIRQTR